MTRRSYRPLSDLTSEQMVAEINQLEHEILQNQHDSLHAISNRPRRVRLAALQRELFARNVSIGRCPDCELTFVLLEAQHTGVCANCAELAYDRYARAG
jgi:hypothetical protein